MLFFRNPHGSVITITKDKNYDDNYLAELADQAGYNMDDLINTFKTIQQMLEPKS